MSLPSARSEQIRIQASLLGDSCREIRLRRRLRERGLVDEILRCLGHTGQPQEAQGTNEKGANHYPITHPPGTVRLIGRNEVYVDAGYHGR